MEILWLKISDFKSFRGVHKIDFRRYAPGLYFMHGENKAEPELGANGSGKSTVWDALHWCWFGTSVRGVPTTQLIPWQGAEEKTWVEFAYRSAEGVIKIRRTYRPNSISIKSGKTEKKVTQDELDDLLGMNSEAVQNSIIVGQFSRAFFDLKPREKLNILTELMDLDYWLGCASKASQTASALRDEKIEIDEKLSAKRAVIAEHKRTIGELEDEAGGTTDTAKLKRERGELQSELKRLKIKRRNASDTLKKNTDAVELYETRVSKARKQKEDTKEQMGKLETARVVAALKMDELRGQTKDLMKKKLGIGSYKCPACGQDVTDEHRRKELRRIKSLMWKQRDIVNEKLAEIAKISHEVDRHTNDVTKFKNRIDAADISGWRRQVSAIDSDIRRTLRRLEKIDTEVADIEGRAAFYEEKINAAKDRLKKAISNRSKLKKSLNEIEVALSRATYWAKTFKEIRLFELNDVLSSLQVEINSYLADLGMESWSVDLEVERETKRGNINRGFRVMVDPGGGAKSGPKPWEAWSGGEGQRLRLGGTMAMASLILRQFSRTCDFQVWDEKLYWLSGSGEDDMLELLQEIAHNEGKQIWIVDQHNLDFPFDGMMKVVKDHKGSRVIQ